MIKLTGSDVKADLLELADKYPGVVDTHGMYFNSDGAPSCLVGHVLHKHGLQYGKVKALNINGAGFPTLRSYLTETFEFDRQASDLLYTAQRSQDVQNPWKRAVKDAIDTVEAEFGYPL